MASKPSTSNRALIWSIILGLLIAVLVILSFQFEINGRITSNGKVRKYLIYVPDSYDPGSPAPLVISIHGFVQWPAHQQGMTGWNEVADEHGFLVVYPRGTGFPLRWNTRPDSAASDSGVDDLGFLVDLLDHLERSYTIDSDRIYVNGMSNGGGMTDLLACELSDRIAAVGGVAGAYTYPREDCTPARPVPVIAFHGLEDQVVPYVGGASSRDERYTFPAVEDWAASWASKNSCASGPKEEKITEHVDRLEYQSCAENSRVVFYRVEDGGHTWPGGDKLPEWIAGYTNQEINASRLMWEFFEKYSLQQ